MIRFAEVVVNRPMAQRRVVRDGEAALEQLPLEPGPDPFAVTFTYLIPEHLQDQVVPGQLVEVPFRSGTLQAVVVGLSDRPPPDIAVRPLTSILEATPLLSPTQLQLARWLSASYLAPLRDCVELFLPPGIQRLPQTVVEVVPGKTPPPDMDARAVALYRYLQKKGATPVDELEAATLKILTDIQLVSLSQRLAPPRVHPDIERSAELIATAEEVVAALPQLGHSSQQADVLLHLAALDDPLPALGDVLDAAGCGESVVRQLAKRGWVKLAPRQAMVDTPLADAKLEEALAALAGKPARRAALAFLQSHPGPQLAAKLEVPRDDLAALERHGYIRRWQEPATVSLILAYDGVIPAVLELRGAARHAAVLDMLAHEEGRVWAGWVYLQTGANLEILKRLQAAGLVALDEARRWRDPLAERSFVLETPPQLTPEQAGVWEVIAGAIGASGARKSVFLLHGVTGSGKTEVYLRAVAEVLQRGQGAIVLVPEIALAAQTVQRVAARFPGKVAVWHSDLSLGERFDTWQRVRDGQLPVVVGARSALFAPVRNLGLIVVDEEHEPAYKQARSPRYHARDVALQLGQLAGAAVILGSATPDVVTFRRAERGELQLLSLPRRVLAHRQHLAQLGTPLVKPAAPVNGQPDVLSLPLPPVEVVDLCAELKAGNTSIFSRSLQQALRQTLSAGQQTILYLNRRGTATFVLCRDCGYVLICPRCQLPFTYHSADEALICHHCNRRQPNPTQCPACHSSRIRYFGLGTERVEAAVRDRFPDARPLRWDQDTARVRGSHAAFLQQFVEGQANVLIGTQMIAKGLDLPRVTLVGVISADTALFFPDFRAAERTFQLLTQVAGRAGRSPLGGRVIVQTYHPELSIIQAAAAHDYAVFYREELAARRDGRYPPYKRLARLVFSGTGAERAQHQAEALAALLRSTIARRGEPNVDILGPAPCFYPKLHGQYRWHIIVRADQPQTVIRSIPLALGWRVDVDPTDFL
jgi:primosomal protein N' (replication factor Y)